MAVEEVGGLKEQGVGGQLGVGTVEAVGLVERMIGDSLRARGDADLRAYFRMKGVK